MKEEVAAAFTTLNALNAMYQPLLGAKDTVVCTPDKSLAHVKLPEQQERNRERDK